MIRGAFTLIEMVVVILILGILGAIAAPKLFHTTGAANDNCSMQSLVVVRDAIELYSMDNGGVLPGADGSEATFKSDLAPYLRSFPRCLVGAANDQIRITNGGTLNGQGAPNKGWAYSRLTGEFIINSNQPSACNPSINYDKF